MVGLKYLMLLKLLHYKRKKRDRGDQLTKNVNKTCQDIQIKKEANDELVCRVCLKDGDIPIYGSNSAPDISQDFLTFANTQINRDDFLPKYLCQACHSLLQGAILFRKTAQESEDNLRQTSFLNQNEHDDSFDHNEYLNPDPTELLKPSLNSFYNCKRCNLSFITFKEYNEHRISLDHENMRQVCPICNKSYKAIYFKKHLALHEQESMYMCDICGKKFVIKGLFERHRAIHNFNFPFKCSLCPYRGRFRESLKSHMYTHTGEKPYQCSQCPFRCVSKSNLNKHAVIHKKDHDFKCESCSRGFYTKRNLELHLKVDHTGIKEHICNICGKEFGYRKQMMKHQLKVHKRQKMRTGRMPLYMQLQVGSQEEIR